MKMRRAVTRTRAARMAAEGDGFALFVPAVRIAAIAVFEFDQGKVTRIGFDAAQLDRFRFLNWWRRPVKSGRCRDNPANFSQPVDSVLRIWRRSRPIGSSEPQPPRTSYHGAARISGVESFV